MLCPNCAKPLEYRTGGGRGVRYHVHSGLRECDLVLDAEAIDRVKNSCHNSPLAMQAGPDFWSLVDMYLRVANVFFGSRK
jgi:hypothetical protein